MLQHRMAAQAPSSFNQHIFFEANSVFYGTDDGYQDGSFTEFTLFEDFYDSVHSKRRENIYLVSVVGGLYGLNLIPLWKPKKITFFDINPHAVEYFSVVRRVWMLSSSKGDFLNRLTNQDYDVDSPSEELIRENLALKQQGRLPRSRGSSKQSLEISWRNALEHFGLTKEIMASVPFQVRTEGIASASFGEFIRHEENLWMYCTNIVEFTFGGLRFDHPANVAIVSVVYPGQVELLDLAPFGDRPVQVQFEIPLKATVAGAQLIPDETPTTVPDVNGIRLAKFCCEDLALPANGRLLDVGCGYGRLAVGLGSYLDEGGEYQGFDPQRDYVIWARQQLMPSHKSCVFHIAHIRNRIYNPAGLLSPTEFRFPYHDQRFDAVVAHSLFPYLLAEEFEHYVAEIARVLKSGGHLLATFFLLDEESRKATPYIAEPHCFRYAAGGITTTGPNRGGLGAHDENYVRNVFRENGIEVGKPLYGSWRGHANGRFEEDALVGTKR